MGAYPTIASTAFDPRKNIEGVFMGGYNNAQRPLPANTYTAVPKTA
jgi:hypothetical protein